MCFNSSKDVISFYQAWKQSPKTLITIEKKLSSCSKMWTHCHFVNTWLLYGTHLVCITCQSISTSNSNSIHQRQNESIWNEVYDGIWKLVKWLRHLSKLINSTLKNRIYPTWLMITRNIFNMKCTTQTELKRFCFTLFVEIRDATSRIPIQFYKDNKSFPTNGVEFQALNIKFMKSLEMIFSVVYK